MGITGKGRGIVPSGSAVGLGNGVGIGVGESKGAGVEKRLSGRMSGDVCGVDAASGTKKGQTDTHHEY